MIPPIASRIPLVRRPKAPALGLDERISHLIGLTVEPAGASHHDLVARASGVLNYAALIASDVGMPDLAADLCWRQHYAFASARHLTGDIAVMALMPLVNISRLLTREGDGEGAYDVLTRLYRAAQQRDTAHIHGHAVDLQEFMAAPSDHRKICEELWMALLVDGARALARNGRWTQAAEAMAAHRGVGTRLLDGRQIMIMSLMERGLDQRARDAIETTAPAERWEHAIAALLRVHCRPEHEPAPAQELDAALAQARELVASPEAATAVFQTRAGLAALDLIPGRTDPRVALLHEAITDVAGLDAYAAREVLNHPGMAAHLSGEQKQQLTAVLAAAGLGAGELPDAHVPSFTSAVDKAEGALRDLVM
jgi:hypothetical protein